MEKIGSICILNRGGLPLKKGPLRIYGLIAVSGSISSYIRSGLFLGVDLPDLKCRWTQSFPWDGCLI